MKTTVKILLIVIAVGAVFAFGIAKEKLVNSICARLHYVLMVRVMIGRMWL